LSKYNILVVTVKQLFLAHYSSLLLPETSFYKLICHLAVASGHLHNISFSCFKQFILSHCNICPQLSLSPSICSEHIQVRASLFGASISATYSHLASYCAAQGFAHYFLLPLSYFTHPTLLFKSLYKLDKTPILSLLEVCVWQGYTLPEVLYVYS
jgi:hypothetical protein